MGRPRGGAGRWLAPASPAARRRGSRAPPHGPSAAPWRRPGSRRAGHAARRGGAAGRQWSSCAERADRLAPPGGARPRSVDGGSLRRAVGISPGEPAAGRARRVRPRSTRRSGPRHRAADRGRPARSTGGQAVPRAAGPSRRHHRLNFPCDRSVPVDFARHPLVAPRSPRRLDTTVDASGHDGVGHRNGPGPHPVTPASRGRIRCGGDMAPGAPTTRSAPTTDRGPRARRLTRAPAGARRKDVPWPS